MMYLAYVERPLIGLLHLSRTTTSSCWRCLGHTRRELRHRHLLTAVLPRRPWQLRFGSACGYQYRAVLSRAISRPRGLVL